MDDRRRSERHAAFEELVDTCQPMLFNVAYRILGEEAAAADATRDALQLARHSVDTFHGGCYQTWLLRILVNACRARRRWSWRRPVNLLKATLARRRRYRTATVGDVEGWRDVPLAELDQLIQDGLATPNAEQRTAVVLSDMQGLSYAEIAGIVDAPIEAVRTRIARGRARLRDYLSGRERNLGV